MHVLIIPSERFVSADSPLGGIFQYHQASALAQSGLQVGLIAPEALSLRHWPAQWSSAWAGIERAADMPFPAYRFQGVNWTAGPIPLLYPYAYQWRWEQIGKQMFKRYVATHGKPDLVHAHNSLQAGIFAAHSLVPKGLPLVITEHSTAYERQAVSGWQAGQVRFALKKANARLAVSPSLIQVIERQFGYDAGLWQYVPNIVDELFEFTTLDPKTPRATRPFSFLYIAALLERKNPAGLIEAFAQAFAGNPDVQLQIGGAGPLRSTLEELVRQRQLESQVTFLGQISRSQVLSAMQQADAFVLPSDYETFGVVLIEAAACGCPLIATSGSGPDAIIHEGNGLLVPPGDIPALAQALRQMHATADRYDAQAIRRDCLARFGQSAIVDRLKDVYAQVLDHAGGRR